MSVFLRRQVFETIFNKDFLNIFFQSIKITGKITTVGLHGKMNKNIEYK
jgi:hypothetical protein